MKSTICCMEELATWAGARAGSVSISRRAPVPACSCRGYDEGMKFEIDDVLVHRKTGRRYRILIGADLCRLEASGEPAYAYRLDDAQAVGDLTVWVRVASEMEDGRFEPV